MPCAETQRADEVREFMELDHEEFMAIYYGTDEDVKKIQQKIEEFKKRSKFIDFTEKPKTPPLQTSMRFTDTIYIPKGNYTGID